MMLSNNMLYQIIFCHTILSIWTSSGGCHTPRTPASFWMTPPPPTPLQGGCRSHRPPAKAPAVPASVQRKSILNTGHLQAMRIV